MSSTTKTRFMIISDTHGFIFGDAEKYGGAFVKPTPQVDVLLHCGDLTYVGGIPAYKECFKMLGSIDAELKLVIAGNHDRDLDQNYNQNPRNPDPEIQENYEAAIAFWKGPLAKEAGITYLEEGVNTFELQSGVKFTIYTSPYQPEFCHWAFPYERTEDRFNPPEKVAPGVKCIAQNPIPDFPSLDIVMTHGPPKGILDLARDGQGVGCEALIRAASRARPKLMCFGHIHEAYGMSLVKWKDDKNLIGNEAIKEERKQDNVYPGASTWDIKKGDETLMVNAAIMNLSYKPVNAPWLIDLGL